MDKECFGRASKYVSESQMVKAEEIVNQFAIFI